jgi:outer membrane protein assembly factor BamB
MSIEPRKLVSWSHETTALPPAFVGDLAIAYRTDGTLVAATAEHSIRWQRELGAPAPPLRGEVQTAAVAGVFIVRAGTKLHGIEPSSGGVRWSHDLAFGSTRPLPWRAELVDTGLPAIGMAPSVYATDPSTGAQRLLLEREVLPKPVAVVGDVLIALERKACVALDLASGNEAWSVDLARPSKHPPGQGRPVGEPAVESDRIVFPISGYGFIALDKKSGAVLWERKLDAQPNHCMGVHDDVAHVLTASRYTAFSTADGKVLVSKSISKLTRPLGIIDVGLPAFFGSSLFAADETGTAFAFDPKTLAITWHEGVGARIPFACRPAVAHDKLWLMSIDGKLHVYELAR